MKRGVTAGLSEGVRECEYALRLHRCRILQTLLLVVSVTFGEQEITAAVDKLYRLGLCVLHCETWAKVLTLALN